MKKEKPKKTIICIDQQGGKGGGNYSIDVCCPLLSNSHGTPHAIAIIYEDTDREEIF